MLVTYSGCWNLHILDYIFKSDDEESFTLTVKTMKTEFTHHYIGFMNDEFFKNQSCPCLYKKGMFMIHENGMKIKQESNIIFEDLPTYDKDNQIKYEFKVRAQEEEFDVIVNEKTYTVRQPGESFSHCAC